MLMQASIGTIEMLMQVSIGTIDFRRECLMKHITQIAKLKENIL